MLIAKVLWKVSGDCNAKKPAPMKTMQKGPIDTSKTNSKDPIKRKLLKALMKPMQRGPIDTSKTNSKDPIKRGTGNDQPGKKQ